MGNVFNTIAMVLQLLSALGVILLVLLQHGKGADMGAAFGSGASGSLFGATGSANFLSRVTAAMAAVFFVSTLALAFFAHDQPRSGGSVMEGVSTPPSSVPSLPGQAPSSVPPANPASPSGQVPPAGASTPSAPSSSVPPAPSAAPAPSAPSGTGTPGSAAGTSGAGGAAEGASGPAGQIPK